MVLNLIDMIVPKIGCQFVTNLNIVNYVWLHITFFVT